MAATLSISIIIPTRNRRDVLGRLLLSTLAQDRKDVEAIIVDDGSEQPVDLAAIRQAIGGGDELPVKLVRFPKGRGACAARNAGAAIAEGRLLLFVDDDIEFVGTDLFGRLLQFIEANPTVGVVALAELNPDGTWGFNLGPAGKPIEVARFHGCGAAFRRECFDQTGGFLEPLGYYYEEFELSMRVIDAKWRIVFDPDLQIVHHRDPRGRDNRGIRRLISSNALLTGFARFPLWMLPATSAAQLARYTMISLSERPRDPFGVFGVLSGALKRLPKVLRERKAVRSEALREYKRLANHPVPWPHE